MPIRACEKCLENNWSFSVFDGYVTATCKICGSIIEFPTKKEIKRILREKSFKSL